MEHLQYWLSRNWGITKEDFDSKSPSSRLREDLHLDDIALEDLFYYLETKCNKKVSDYEVFGRSQTIESIGALFKVDAKVKENKVAFLFPGQGAQSIGIGQSTVQVNEAKALFTKAQEILGYDLLDLCANGPQEKLDQTVYSQVAIFVCSLAELEVLKVNFPELVQKCSCVAGLSLGEYSALVAAGVMDFETGLRLVQLRATAMQEAANSHPGGMVSVLGATEATVTELITEVNAGTGNLTIANLLCPGNIVVSGDTALCDIVAEKGTKPPYNAKATRKLAVAGAFHSNLMLPAQEALQQALADVSFSLPNKTVMCNLTGGKYQVQDSNIKTVITTNLTQQLTSPVRWEKSIKELLDEGYNRFYDMGPGTVLTGLMRHTLRPNPQYTDVEIEKPPAKV